MSRNMIIRTIVALIFGPLIILIGYAGGWWLLGMILLFSFIGIIEYLRPYRAGMNSLGLILAIIFVPATVLASTKISFEAGFMLIVIFFLVNGLLQVMDMRPPEMLFLNMTVVFWGVAYLGLLYPFLYMIRILSSDGGHWVFFLFGTLWLSDSLAMWIGGAFGKKKLSPTVSPGKTVIGFLAGLAGGLIVGAIMSVWLLSDISWPLLLGAGLLISLVGQLGDLVESCWKRSVAVKDSSGIIPGHGGILDRFDSLLFAAPALYLFLKTVIYG